MRFSPRSGFSSRQTGGRSVRNISPRIGRNYRGYYGPRGWLGNYTYPYYTYPYPYTNTVYVKDENIPQSIYVPCASAGQRFEKNEISCCPNLDKICVNDRKCMCQTPIPK